MNNVKDTIAKNLIELRKSKKLTQQALADKLGYSDKAVSRWEHGETLPDIETLCKICDIYGVRFEYLLEEDDPEEKKKLYAKRKESRLARVMITLIALCTVWLLASAIYTYSQGIDRFWMIFFWALPFSSLVLSVCNKMWGNRIFGAFISSFTNWTLMLSIFLQFIERKMWMFFIIGIPIQLIIIFIAILNKNKKHRYGSGSKRSQRGESK